MATAPRTPPDLTMSAPATALSGAWLSQRQAQTLAAVCDALLPATTAPAGEDDAHGFYARPASAIGVAQLVADALAAEVTETRRAFAQLLDLLESPALGMLLIGRAKGFSSASAAQREAMLRAMSVSRVAKLRQGFQGIKRLAGFVFYSAPLADGRNPNWETLEYTPAPAPPSPQEAPKRLRVTPVRGDMTLMADAVVVGSGAGGGMVAAQLAAAGKDVVVLEKGGYYNEADFSGMEAEMTQKLYLRRGLLTTRDLGMVALAGSALGGGTLVNWSTSLRTPAETLDEWERVYGLSGVSGAEYQEGFAVAERRMGVNRDDSAPNPNNDALRRGCEALGYAWSYLPRNAADCQQRCGACGYGCPHGRKQSTMLTFLQDASDHGARIIVGCAVERALIEAGRAVGVEGWASDAETGERRRVRVQAPLVVVAGGSVESPALLLRSGLTNPNIGRHLRLHPVAPLFGQYDEMIEPWRGSLQTIVSGQFAHMDGAYGFRIEMMPAHPGLLGLGIPWDGGRAYKHEMSRVAHSAAFIVLARDTGEGRITLDSAGEPIIDYWPNQRDRAYLTRGMSEVARIAFAGGARRVATAHTPTLSLTAEPGAGGVSEARLRAFTTEVERRGVAPNRLLLGTAHQMGSCRLGGSAREAVADPYGQVYGVKGLFIADASGFPTASGVNPMLSTMALAYRVVRRILAER